MAKPIEQVEKGLKKIDQRREANKRLAKYCFIGFVFFVLLIAIVLKSITWDDDDEITEEPKTPTEVETDEEESDAFSPFGFGLFWWGILFIIGYLVMKRIQ